MSRPNDVVAYVHNNALHCDGCTIAMYPTVRTEEVDGVGEVARWDLEAGDTCRTCGCELYPLNV